ncbi:MAG: flagellar hook-associated protein FlgK [Alphaproteobacteria bacterium]|nr:MAG: flagellar hook-associated protein FlgK [Alphaproteobacteria bacterium]
MSIQATLNNAMSGLRVAQSSLQILSLNISNAAVPDYTRKELVQKSKGGNVDGLGGVTVASYERSTDRLTYKALNQSLTESGYSGVGDDYLSRVQGLIGSSSDSPKLPSLLDRFNSAWRSLEAAPESVVQQREVISSGQSLAQEIQRLSAGVEELDRSLRTDTGDAIEQLNLSLETITTLNNQVSNGKANNLPTGDFEDRRDTELRKVCGLLDITIMERKDGSVALYTPDGYPLLDQLPKTFTYNGATITDTINSIDVTSYLKGGKIEALLDIRSDTSPAAPSSNATEEVIRKLRSQLDLVASSFLTVAAGPPQSFASAYNSGAAQAGELNQNFFTGTDRLDIAINANLMNGTSVIKKASIAATAAALDADTRSFTADGLSVPTGGYTNMVSSLVAVWSQSAGHAKDINDINKGQSESLEKRYKDSVGVNIDEEVLNMTTLQTAYTASARVITAVKQMFDILESLMSG